MRREVLDKSGQKSKRDDVIEVNFLILNNMAPKAQLVRALVFCSRGLRFDSWHGVTKQTNNLTSSKILNY